MKPSILIFAFSSVVAAPASATEDKGSATLSLAEVLRLHKMAETQTEKKTLPPVPYSVSRFDVEGSIIGEAIEAVATVELSVFADGWVRVPLLEPDATLDITKLPTVDNGHFMSGSGSLSFLTEKAGTYKFDVAFLKRAARRGATWEASLSPAEASIRRLRVRHDEGLFEIVSDAARRDGNAFIVFATHGRLSLAWKALRTVDTTRKPEQERPPIEPVVTQGAASIVVTLDGQRITRSSYSLRFQGPQTLVVQVPHGQELTKVYLNGISRGFDLEDGSAKINVTPPRPGDQTAVVEVVLKEKTSPMALAGTLVFKLPTLSWGLNEMQCTLFLPSVFNYSWVGGSLSPSEAVPLPPYTLDIPTPGKSITAKQQLVNGSPDVVVEYTVDLTENYFR